MAAVIEDRQLVNEVERHRPSQISWGAVLAGLVLILAGSWLLLLLGSAIGVGVVDATDGDAVGNGLGTGAIVWMFVTTLVVYFAGSYLTARLSGKSDRAIGLLHGATVWSAGTALMVVLGYMGAANVAQIGQAAISQTGGMFSSMISSGASGAQRFGATGSAQNDAGTDGGSSLMNTIGAQIKRKASEALAARVPGVSAGELRDAAGDIDAAVMTDVATRLVRGDIKGARAALAEQTSLSEQEINNLTDEAMTGAQQLMPQELKDRLEQRSEQMRQRLGESIAEATAGGANGQVDEQAVQNALSEIDPALIESVGGQLMEGDTEGARAALAEQTSLSSSQVDQLVNDLSNEFRQEIEEMKTQFAQAVDGVQQQMLATTGAAIADMDARGGPQVTQQEIERALTQLDGEALGGIAEALFSGDIDGAKNQLAIHTTLSEAEINDLAEGVNNEVSEQIAEVREQINTATEAAADYAQMALWLTFLASALGLAVSLFGGMVGASQSKKLVASSSDQQIVGV